MGATVQLEATASKVGNVYTTAVWGEDNKVKFIYESKEVRISLTTNVSLLLDHYLTEHDFDRMRELVEDIEVSSGNRKSQLENVLMSEYNAIQIKQFKSTEQDYVKYMNKVTELLLEDLDNYIEDIPELAFIEIYT